jgi:NADPH:quinone reductase-like Zn-dependent oxidoreductase
MRAIILQQFGGLDSLVIENLPDPVPQPGSVLIEVKAFGINHAETHMRKGEWAEAATVSGMSRIKPMAKWSFASEVLKIGTEA